ncbi:MAG TPA: F0F1 ATP synthase subunit B [Thermomicrobiales bacterium]|nr:F0F1 ATP synthase subunit B [Thermomicrobiales bacterium]
MDALGINAANLIVQILAFLLFIWLFWKFALGPITGMLDTRQERIRESIEAAQRMEDELQKTRAQNEEIMAEARREAQGLIARAREVSDQNIARSKEQAQVQADELIDKARDAIAAETAQARADLRREVGDLAVMAASKIVRANLDRDAQTRLIEEALAEAGATGSNGSSPVTDD